MRCGARRRARCLAAGVRAVGDSPRRRRDAVPAREPGLRQELDGRRRSERPGEAGAPDAHQHVHRAAAPQRVRVRRMVPRSAAGRRSPFRRDARSTRPPGRCSRATPTTRNSATAWRSCTRQARRTRSHVTGRSSSGATARWPGRRRSARPRLAGRAGARTRSLRGTADRRSRSRPGSRARSRSSSARRATGPRAIVACGAVLLARRGRRRARTRDAVLGRHAGHRAGAHARRLVRSAGQPLAAVPDAELPHLGALRAIPARRRVRVPRSAAGRHGAALRAPGSVPGAPAARGVAAVHRGRRAALVASAGRPRHPDAVLRRSAVAAVRRGRVRASHRRPRRARRARAVPRGAAARAASAGGVRDAGDLCGQRPRCSSTCAARSTDR